MPAGNRRRLYYYHLKKCGGSTLNQWLDTLGSDERRFDPGWIGAWMFGILSHESTLEAMALEKRLARSLFYWTDIVHSHAAIRQHVPDGTFCFTVLRDPVKRLVSQVLDWRRLQPHDVVGQPRHIQQCVGDCRRLRLKEVLLRHGYGGGGMFMNNYMTRALAAGRMGRLALDIADPARLADLALQSLESDYDFVGLTERHQDSRNALCALLGLPPARPIPHLNGSADTERDDEEFEEALPIIHALTGIDAVVYERARQIFDSRYAPLAASYSDEAFETHHAAATVGAQTPRHDFGASRLSVRDPIIGSGLHGRDGAGGADCAVWTGPERTATLYMPVPRHLPVDVLVWIRGYAEESLRQGFTVRIDGQPARHELVPEPNYADLMVVRACTDRDFIRLDLEVRETLPDPGGLDPRLRGLSFDAYGWRPA
jgi:hypothetical protein